MGGNREDTSRAVELLGAAGLLNVVHDGMDQPRLQSLYERITAGNGPRSATLDKEGLCTSVVRALLRDAHAMELVGRELARVSRREAGLVESLKDDEVRERILALPALQLRRERARMMWALSSNPRAAAQSVARELLNGLHEAVGKAGALARDPSSDVRRKAEEMEHQSRAAERQAEGLQARLARMERERADALARLGAREAQLRDEVNARAEAEREAGLLNARVRDLETRLQESHTEVIRLRDAVRMDVHDRALSARLESLQERLRHAHDERDTLTRQLQDAQEREQRMKDDQHLLSTSMVAREQVAQERIQRLRLTLRDVRKQRARTASDESAPPDVTQERIALHVDVANLTAGAHRLGKRSVDFTGLLTLLGAGRRVKRAVAYCVEQGAPARFQHFCAALRDAGYEVRIKKPVTRADGSVKADWDMGLAMDVVEDTERVDTVILCSGDGDFVPLLQLMRRRGKRVEVASFRADTHEELLRTAHEFHALGDRHLI